MQYWLVKSEPSTWSWDDQIKAGEQGTGWDGVRNYQASNNLKSMKLGDLAFFYHSVHEKQIVGIVKVIGLYEPDLTDQTGRFGMVRFAAYRPFKKGVNLAQIKADPDFAHLHLIRQSRLSVMPIDSHSWTKLCALGEISAD